MTNYLCWRDGYTDFHSGTQYVVTRLTYFKNALAFAQFNSFSFVDPD